MGWTGGSYYVCELTARLLDILSHIPDPIFDGSRKSESKPGRNSLGAKKIEGHDSEGVGSTGQGQAKDL